MSSRSRFLLLAGLTFALVAVGPAMAAARHVRFLGPHPVSSHQGGGYCYIDVPHVHIYVPEHPALYHESDGGYLFTGDPAPFGYEGEKHTFYGHHPIPDAPGVYCYIDGPHFHVYAPPAVPEYRTEGGVAFYLGPFAPVYYEEKPRRQRLVQETYRPFVALRPAVRVTPPPEWHGEVWVPPPPSVTVNVPSPQVEVNVPGVVVGLPAPHVLVRPPSPHVVVTVPSPHVVVGLPAPPGVVFGVPSVHRGPERHEHEHEHEHGREHERDDDEDHGRGSWRHDNGKHKGWDKHED